MLAAWLMKEEIKQAREEGRAEGYAEGYAEGCAEARNLALEAERQRREGETLEQTLARMETERPNRR